MPFLPPPQFNFPTPLPAFRPLFNFQQPVDNVFGAQLLASFAMNDIKDTEIIANLYPKDILILAVQ